MVLSGRIQEVPLGILVDSGSSHSFLSASVAQNLSGVSLLTDTLKVQVASGTVLQCTSHIYPASPVVSL